MSLINATTDTGTKAGNSPDAITQALGGTELGQMFTKLLVAQMQADKGLITKEDLKDYKAVWREPMALSWRGNEIGRASCRERVSSPV